MADKKESFPKLTTPKGTFKYPRLNEPDYGTDDYPIEGGAFSVRLIMSSAEAKPLIDKLTPLYEKAIEEGKAKFKELKPEKRKQLKELKTNDFYTEVLDEDEKPTGDVEFRFKMKHSGVSKKTQKPWKRKPTIFDAKGKPMVTPPSIWGGTVGKVSFEARPYWVQATGTAGLSLSLNAVQIIDLVSGGNRSAADFGFGEEEGYEFSAEDTAEKPASDDADTSDNDGEGDDF